MISFLIQNNPGMLKNIYIYIIYIYIYIYIAIMQLQLEASYPVHGIERISVVLSVSFSQAAAAISLKGVRVSQ